MIKKIGIIGLGLVLLLIAMLFEDLERQNLFIYSLYYLTAFATLGLGYIDIADPVKLGFGITRFTIFIKFTLSVFSIVLVLWCIHLASSFFVGMIYSNLNWLSFIHFDIMLLLSLLVISFSQIGMLFGNTRMNKWIGVPITGVLIVIVALIVINEFLVWWFFVLLSGLSVGLWIVNFMLIKNIRLERS